MGEIAALLKRWEVDEHEVKKRMYRAPTPRERERWHALWLLAQGWTAGPVGLAFEQTGGSPPAWLRTSRRS